MTSYFRSLAFGIHGYSQYTKDGFAKNIKDEDADADDESKDCLKRDLTNISVLITGANGGIGFATAVALARRNATVHLLCRSMHEATVRRLWTRWRVLEAEEEEEEEEEEEDQYRSIICIYTSATSARTWKCERLWRSSRDLGIGCTCW